MFRNLLSISIPAPNGAKEPKPRTKHKAQKPKFRCSNTITVAIWSGGLAEGVSYFV